MSSSTGGRSSNIEFQPPIIVVDDSWYPELYPTLDAAIADLEGVDVADEIYRVFDAVGRRIVLRAEGVRRDDWSVAVGTVGFDSVETTPTGADELSQLLREHLAAVSASADQHADLPTLVRLVEHLQGK